MRVFHPFPSMQPEQHLMSGTGLGFAAADNPHLGPSTRMVLLKPGVSFQSTPLENES